MLNFSLIHDVPTATGDEAQPHADEQQQRNFQARAGAVVCVCVYAYVNVCRCTSVHALFGMPTTYPYQPSYPLLHLHMLSCDCIQKHTHACTHTHIHTSLHTSTRTGNGSPLQHALPTGLNLSPTSLLALRDSFGTSGMSLHCELALFTS